MRGIFCGLKKCMYVCWELTWKRKMSNFEMVSPLRVSKLRGKVGWIERLDYTQRGENWKN